MTPCEAGYGCTAPGLVCLISAKTGYFRPLLSIDVSAGGR
jgi:hypothetical protein